MRRSPSSWPRADPSGPETCLSSSSPACGRGRRRRSVWWHGSPWGAAAGFGLGRGLYPLAFMKTDAPLSDQLMINAPLRAAQVKVAALNGMARPAIEAFRALERETPDDEVGGVFRLVTVFSLLTGPLELWASDWLPLVLNIPVDAVDRTTALLAKAEAELTQQAA